MLGERRVPGQWHTHGGRTCVPVTMERDICCSVCAADSVSDEVAQYFIWGSSASRVSSVGEMHHVSPVLLNTVLVV